MKFAARRVRTALHKSYYEALHGGIAYDCSGPMFAWGMSFPISFESRKSMHSSSRCNKFPGVILTAFLAVVGFWPGHAMGQAPRRQPSKKGEEPPGLSEYTSTTGSEIQKMMDEYSRLPKKPIGFACNMILAHGALIQRVPLEVLLACADALKEAGAQRIDINPMVTSHPDAEVASKYKALIQHIRELGLKIAINPESSDPKIGGIATFPEYQKAALKEYAEWASQYKPEHFVLVHEPTTMAARMHVKTTPEQWRSFVEATARVVKSASPKTRIGAGCFAGLGGREVPFFEEFARIQELQFLTFDNYVGDARAIARMDLMARVAHEAQKPVYMEETWRPHFVLIGAHHVEGKSMESESLIGFGYAGFEALDGKWIEAMALYAATHGLESMTVFQTRCFFLYVQAEPTDGPLYDKRVEQAILQKNRTETFEAFRRCSQQLGRH